MESATTSSLSMAFHRSNAKFFTLNFRGEARQSSFLNISVYKRKKTTNDRTIRPFLWQLLTFWLLLRLASDVALDGLSSKWLNLQTGYFNILVGGFNSLEKIISQWEGLSHILWKTTNVSNHKPEYRNINVPFMHGFVRTTCAKSTNSPLNRI